MECDNVNCYNYDSDNTYICDDCVELIAKSKSEEEVYEDMVSSVEELRLLKVINPAVEDMANTAIENIKELANRIFKAQERLKLG